MAVVDAWVYARQFSGYHGQLNGGWKGRRFLRKEAVWKYNNGGGLAVRGPEVVYTTTCVANVRGQGRAE